MTTALKRFTASILRRPRPLREGASVGGAGVGADVDAAHLHGRRLVDVGHGRFYGRAADAVARIRAELALRPAAERELKTPGARQDRRQSKARMHASHDWGLSTWCQATGTTWRSLGRNFLTSRPTNTHAHADERARDSFDPGRSYWR